MAQEVLRKADSRRSSTLTGNCRDLFLQTIIEDHCNFAQADDVIGNDKRRSSASYFLQETEVNSQQHKNRLQVPNSGMDSRKAQSSSRGSLFTNFEDVRLSDEEHVYLTAAVQGDVPIIRQSLYEADATLNINCVDYMGRSALHLAVDSESLEAIELLLEKINFECVEESLLHAISKGATKIVRLMIEHPNYIAGAERSRRTQKDPFFRTDEKSQFSPDVTPIILAAHYNNHEMIQLFLSRNHTIDKPHPISCQCADCITKQNYDSLKRSRSRLNAYRALASPAYMALSSPDPIMTTFELRQEMKKLAQVEKEFKNEYMSLVEQCMNFACELMDLCRGTQEVEAVLSEGGGDKYDARDPLARLKMAMEYEEKKFVAHPNCQQHLTSIWYGPEMGFLQSLTLSRKVIMWVTGVPMLPFFCLLYIISPGTKIGLALRCPASKFITHTLSNICFLILLAAATFRLEEKTRPISNFTTNGDVIETFPGVEPERESVESILKNHFRPANILMTNVQICLMFWVLGLLWIECKQMYHCGLRVYLLDNYNWMDFVILSLYLSSYMLRFLVDHWIKQADVFYNGTARAREALLLHDFAQYEQIHRDILRNKTVNATSYFMKALRFEWRPDDPEIVSDVLFAVANVLSIARTTYLMPAFEVLGPLQISLGRMLGDITRFLVLFTLVLFAFMVGLHNLYWYYGSQTYAITNREGANKLVHTSEAFQGLPRTLYSLFWSMFGLVSVDSVEIKYPTKERDSLYATSFPGGTHATSIVEGVGMFLFALYHVAIIIVLTNMLIAMMSHSFEAIQGDCDVEWKFARTKLWMNYIDEGSTLPVPFNMIPTPKSFRYAWASFNKLCRSDDQRYLNCEMGKRQTFIRKRRERVCLAMHIDIPQTSYSDILQRLVRRYLFKLERMKEESKETVSMGTENLIPTSTDTSFYGKELGAEGEYDGATSAAVENCNENGDVGIQFDVTKRSLSNKPHVPGTIGARRQPPLTMKGGASGGAPVTHTPCPVQLISLPQLDQIQRALKVLDVRLLHLNTLATEEDRVRQDIEHVLRVISENQKALVSVIKVLVSLQEEVHSLSATTLRLQQTTIQVLPPTNRKKSCDHSKLIESNQIRKNSKTSQ